MKHNDGETVVYVAIRESRMRSIIENLRDAEGVFNELSARYMGSDIKDAYRNVSQFTENVRHELERATSFTIERKEKDNE